MRHAVTSYHPCREYYPTADPIEELEKAKLFQPDDVLAVFGIGDIGAPMHGRARTLEIRRVFLDIQVSPCDLMDFCIWERRGVSSGGNFYLGPSISSPPSPLPSPPLPSPPLPS